MAHVGTTTNLKQPAATGSGRQAGLWLALITGAVVLAIALAFVMTQITGSKSVSGSITGKTGYDAIEAQRGPAMLSIVGDRSYDQIEALRGATAPTLSFLDRGADRGVVSSQPLDQVWFALHPDVTMSAADQIAESLRSVPVAAAADHTYDALRAAAFASTVKANSNADRSHDQFKHAPGRGPLP
jgi:hypothetical protein